MAYDKPFKDFTDQILLLKNKGLIIQNESAAEQILKTISYYDLINGYKDVFMNNHQFCDDRTLDDLFSFFYLDKSVQMVTVKYGLMVEGVFKNKLAYALSKYIGVSEHEYLDRKYYKQNVGPVRFTDVLREVNKALYVKSAKDPTKYYLQNHNHVPPWVLFKNLSLGVVVDLFRFLNTTTKMQVADLMIPSGCITAKEKIELILNGLEGLRRYRNYIAHNLHFIKCKFLYRLAGKSLYSLLPMGVIKKKGGSINKYDKQALAGLYGLIVIMVLFLSNDRLCLELLEEYTNVFTGRDLMDNREQGLIVAYKDCLGLPRDFLKRLKILKSMYIA